jgi:hypothetical protein
VAFSWSVVELAGDLVAVGLGEILHRSALGDVLANETVGVFVGSSLAGGYGVAK